MTQQEAASYALQRIIHKLAPPTERQEDVYGGEEVIELMKMQQTSEAVRLNEDSAKTVLDLRNTIERLANNSGEKRRMVTGKVGGGSESNQILRFKLDHEGSAAAKHKTMHHKMAQYNLSKAYYDKYGFKMMSSSSSSANGGSGGHSSDDQ